MEGRQFARVNKRSQFGKTTTRKTPIHLNDDERLKMTGLSFTLYQAIVPPRRRRLLH
jgi:hypothetical protein